MDVSDSVVKEGEKNVRSGKKENEGMLRGNYWTNNSLYGDFIEYTLCLGEGWVRSDNGRFGL